MIELKPCPFCGGVAIIESTFIFNKTLYFPSCKEWKCLGNSVRSFKSPKAAAKAWNARKGCGEHVTDICVGHK